MKGDPELCTQSNVRSSHKSLLSLSVLFFFPPLLKPRYQGTVMGFDGGGGIIAVATALPLLFYVLYCEHQYCILNINIVL